MTSTFDHGHRAAIANYFVNKVGEFDYQLRRILDVCDSARLAFNQGYPCPTEKEVIYAFSAFAHAMQALKDCRQTLGNGGISWYEMAELPHGAFMQKARNAITHDGNPIINAWANGHFFVALNISRRGANGEPIDIVRPIEDVRTFCLEFAEGFAGKLRDSLHALLGQFEIGGASFIGSEFAKIVHDTTIIPDNIKRIVARRLDEICVAIQTATPIDPIGKAIAELDALMIFARQALNNSTTTANALRST